WHSWLNNSDHGGVGPAFRSLRRPGKFRRHSRSAELVVVCLHALGPEAVSANRQLHFFTFSCYHRIPRLGTKHARDTFVVVLERARKWYGFYVVGYVVMPEHVHLLMSEPERGSLALSLQMLKQVVSRRLRAATREDPFLQPRYYDFNVWSERKRKE